MKDTLDRDFTAPGIAVDAAAPVVRVEEEAAGAEAGAGARGAGGFFLRNGVDDQYHSTARWAHGPRHAGTHQSVEVVWLLSEA